MRTNYAWFLVLAIGISALMWNLSGVDEALTGPGPADELESGGELEDRAPGTPNVNGSASSADGEGDIVGFIISGGQAIAGFVGVVVLLPLELERLGFPYWFAYPIGIGTQFIASIGLIQFVTNRILK